MSPPASTAAQSGIRYFSAISVPEAAQRAVEAAVTGVWGQDPRLRCTRRDTYHLTLHYYGAASHAQLDRVADALDTVAGRHAAFSCELGGWGAFSGWSRAFVVWLGVASGAGPLCALADDARGLGAQAGFVPDQALYVPHLTVARAAKGVRQVALDPPAEPPAAVPLAVGSVVLYASEPGPSGTSYRPLAEFALGPAAEPPAPGDV